MNLQILSLQTMVRSGIKYDGNDPVTRNVIFDVDCVACDIDEKISKLSKRIRNCRQELRKFSDFGTIKLPNMNKYDTIVEEISTLLFDDMEYSIIQTHHQIEWKEYFHGLYDLVIIPYHHDKTHYVQMIQETLKYFNFLKPPSPIEITDPLYPKIETCRVLFNKLKEEHDHMRIPKLMKKLKNHVQIQIKKRTNLAKMINDLNEMYKKRHECTEILRWGTTL